MTLTKYTAGAAGILLEAMPACPGTSAIQARIASLVLVTVGLFLAACSSSRTGATSSGGFSATAGTAASGSSTAGGGAGGSSLGGAGSSGGLGGAGVGTGGTAADGGMGGAAGAGGASAAGGATGTLGGNPEHTGADCLASAGELKENAKLPDPFAKNDGTRISTKAEWTCRRAEIKKDLERYEIGPKPEPPMVEASLSGSTLNVVVTSSAGSITLSSMVVSPAGDGPHCVAIGMNGNASLINGCVQVPFMHDQVVTYAQNSNRSQSDPFYEVYPELWDQIGNYAAWSWGISRLIDGLLQVKDDLNIDVNRIGLQGCSYAGKMALFGGAFDERVALTIAQESGGGGINSWRTSQDFTARTGTDIEKIDNTNYGWFLASMQRLDPYSLPHDHHELIAMIAPRAFLALGNQDFEWLGDESGYKSVNVAKEVWKAMGVEANIGFDFTSNHGHCQAPAAQVSSANAFVDQFLEGQDANTAITIQPQEGNFDLDFSKLIDWETPTLQ